MLTLFIENGPWLTVIMHTVLCNGYDEAFIDIPVTLFRK